MGRIQRRLQPSFGLRRFMSRIRRRKRRIRRRVQPRKTAVRPPQANKTLETAAGAPEKDPHLAIHDFVQSSGGAKKLLRRKRRRSSMYIRATVKKMQEKIEHDLKIQKEQTEKISELYYEEFSTLVVMWNRDLQKVHEEREKLIGTIQQLQEDAEQSQILRNQNMKAFQELFEEFLKKLEELEDDHENVLAHERNELGKETDILQTKLMTETGEEAGA